MSENDIEKAVEHVARAMAEKGGCSNLYDIDEFEGFPCQDNCECVQAVRAAYRASLESVNLGDLEPDAWFRVTDAGVKAFCGMQWFQHTPDLHSSVFAKIFMDMMKQLIKELDNDE